METIGDMKFYSFEEVLYEQNGKIGTPRRDEFEAKVTEIYCLADDFCKEFSKYQEKHMFSTSPKNGKHRNKPNRMSDAEIMLIMILFHSGGYRCFKHFYQEYVCKHLGHLFPRRVSYKVCHARATALTMQ